MGVKITDLPSVSSSANTDYMVVDDGTTTSKITKANFTNIADLSAVSSASTTDCLAINSGSSNSKITLENLLADMYYKAGDTLTITQHSDVGGMLTNAGKALQFIIPLPKPIKAVNVTADTLTLTVRQYLSTNTGGYLLNAVTVTGSTSYTVSCVVTEMGIEVTVAANTAYTNGVNNSPVAIQVRSGSAFTFSN